MLNIPVYNSQGKELTSLALPKNIFGLKVNKSLLHLVTTIFLGNQRKGTAKVKTRSERRGGGKKPYGQKGTGNARAGTIRSPIWRKGGRVFGPTGEQNYHRDLPAKVRIKSLLMGLSAKAQSGHIIGLEDMGISSISTKAVVTLLKSLPVSRSILLVVPEKNKNVTLSTRNISTVTTRTYNNINTLDILSHDFILLITEALPLIEKKWGSYTFKGVMEDEELGAALAKAQTMKESQAEKKTVKKSTKAKTAKPKVASKKPAKSRASTKSSKA
ncbi:MAG: 50S ribosomal protein L4 [Candidatus Abawacabacteria bacterium]|nr:50S ribosomal protein L4 [Candidatus Abawacabacteria bacterium]